MLLKLNIYLKTVNNNLGNALPGIPNSQIFLQLGYLLTNDLNLLISAEHVGELFADNSNTVKVESFEGSDFKLENLLTLIN